jgi:hypothetical protein
VSKWKPPRELTDFIVSSGRDENIRVYDLDTSLAIGRPAGLTDIQDDTKLAEAIAEMRRDGARITRATLAARAGYTEAALRGYLHVTHRSMADLLAVKPPT